MLRHLTYSHSPRGQGWAIGLVALFALAQVGILAMAAYRSQQSPARRVTPEEVVSVTTEAGPPGLPAASKARVTAELFPPVTREQAHRPPAGYAVPPPPPPMDLVEPSAPLSTEATAPRPRAEPEPALEETVRPVDSRDAVKALELATVAEAEGDVKGALNYLRAANVVEPNHPTILYRLGVLLHRIGNLEKARVYFDIIRQMGAAKAGQYYPLAGHYLSGEVPDRRIRGLEDRPFRLGMAEATVTDGEGGERWIKVSASLRSTPGEEVNPGGVYMEILYYDLINGRRPEQLVGEMQEAAWASEIPDWINPEEELVELVFHVPAIPPGPDEESRSFFGFVLKLYYEDEIQDVVADPRVLPEILANQEHQELHVEDSILDDTLFDN